MLVPAGERKPVVTVTRKDLIRQTFTVGGNGGSGKDTSNTGVRFIHPPSGASGEARDSRSQKQNEIEAFRRMCGREGFVRWLKLETARRAGLPTSETPEEIRERVNKAVDEALRSGHILVEEYEA